ncbi:MAG: family 1 glycosylhydrolase [Chloroflexota bacterium]
MSADPHIFPNNFIWGTASSSHQNEGQNTNNQWWAFEQHGTIRNGDRSGLACDWWQNAEEDFDRIQSLHLNAHRLSLEWSRIEPEPGLIATAALDRYRELLGGLRDRGIRPIVALNHFTLPMWFYLQGGWTQKESIVRFQSYARVVAQALHDLCDFWITFNEPLVYVGQTWVRGIWPPCRANPYLAWRAFRHLLFAHAAAYQVLHTVQPNAHVGYAKSVSLFKQLREGNDLDRYAAGIRRHLFEHLWVVGSATGRVEPPLGLNGYHRTLDDSIDFIGLTYYGRKHIRFSPDPRNIFGQESFADDVETSDQTSNGSPYSQYAPDGLYQICQEVRQFDKPIYILENGLPDKDDQRRPRWLLGHLLALHQAIEDGCDVRGYFHWTLVDNFEWDQGWQLRFGLYELDPKTQERTKRPSADLYRAIALSNQISPEMIERYAGGG